MFYFCSKKKNTAVQVMQAARYFHHVAVSAFVRDLIILWLCGSCTPYFYEYLGWTWLHIKIKILNFVILFVLRYNLGRRLNERELCL